MNDQLDDDALLRYSRHLLLPQLDAIGQSRLINSRVLIVGLGGLGSPVALYLAAAGVGQLLLADFDRVELSNLQRQIIHGSHDIGRNKARSAADAVARINPRVSCEMIEGALDEAALARYVPTVDLVVDGSDNFATRFAVNAACVASRVPLVSGAAIRMEGQLVVFDARRPDSPCYRCLYGDDQRELEEGCSEAGVLGPLVGVIGSLQAVEAIKLLAGLEGTLVGRLLLFDAETMEWRELRLNRDPNCPTCKKV